ncbi:unnamed protein product [Pseudo-nitzschia multistriata]|uniref:GST C-terminal domain-containing protein n=1 Tax=Pseudo-nitzschia multistriata TaxID=183589 RepID=A0A448ZT03_9STRA|nr:unnamed protein product [Pseudo-nitzschia multistriata]
MVLPLYTLYTPPGSFFAFAPLIVSEYVGVTVELEKTGSIEQLIASKSPTGASPILETQNGEVIVSSQAIARFIASLRQDTNLLGSDSLRQSLAIECWTNWAAQELELPVCVCCYITKGCTPFNENVVKKGKKDIIRALSVLESQLEKQSSNKNKKTSQTWLVTKEHITLADITVACTLVYPFTLVFDKASLSSFPMVVCWFENCMKEPEFVAVLGKIECGRHENTNF